MFTSKSKKEQITFRIEGDTLKRLKKIEKYHSKITHIIDLGLECYENDISKEDLINNLEVAIMKDKETNIRELEKRYVRVFFLSENGLPIYWEEKQKMNSIEEKKALNPFDSTLIDGWEELDMREDSFKLNFYNTTDKLVLGEKEFKVVNRFLKVDYPLFMNLYLKEIG